MRAIRVLLASVLIILLALVAFSYLSGTDSWRTRSRDRSAVGTTGKIDVTTNGSTVTVSGTVRSAAEHDRAIRIARETAGVTRVVDQLSVGQ